MRGAILTLAALAVMGAIGAAAAVGLGLYNVSAASGHMPGVSWVLHTTFRQSVRLRAIPEEEVPDLSDPALAELGARHYVTACAPCHATPGEDRTATMRSMLPAPPHISEAVQHWEPNHLHWIVLNGIKMSGMPAWPAPQRSEEVWPVVAYLMRVKAGLDPAAQAAMVAQPPGTGPAHAAYCAGCHGGVEAGVPRLDIQTEAYLEHALREYLSGERPSGIMQHAVSRVPETALAPLVTHFTAARPSEPAAAEGYADLPLAMQGTDDVPACTACHGPGTARKPLVPALAGQDRAYLVAQLHLWRAGQRGGSTLMRKAAQDLTDADIETLAEWYAGLPAEPDRP